MMEMMNRELPKTTVISVDHRAELEAFHSRKVVLERRKGGAKLVSDIDLVPRQGKRKLLGRFLRSQVGAEGGVSFSTAASKPSS
jgi:vitamin B12/bleomycin/antimicrobial peptide transport system ATP-binding/permease protein